MMQNEAIPQLLKRKDCPPQCPTVGKWKAGTSQEPIYWHREKRKISTGMLAMTVFE